MLRVRLTKRAIFIHSMLPFLVALYLTWMPWSAPVVLTESLSYINFSMIHPLGYPVFLKVFDLISPERFSIVYIQIWVFAFAVFYLSLSIRKNTDSHLLGIFIGLPVLLNPLILSVHYTILPHSLFISFSLLAIAFFISGFGRAWFLNLFGFGLSIGVCIILEPFGWAYLVLILLAAPLFVRRNHCSLAKAFLLPLLVCLSLTTLESTTHKAVHDTQNDRPHAPHLFTSTLLMDTEQASPYAEKDPRTVIWHKIERDLAGTRSRIWQAENFDQRITELERFEPEIHDFFAQDEIGVAATLLDKTPNEVRLDIAHARIIQDPLSFLSISFDHYRGLWHNDKMITYPLWVMTILTTVIGLWYLLTGARFNAMFASAFISATAIQSLTLWIAYSGVGPVHIVTLLSPFLSICFLSIILGFYIAFVCPLRNDA